MKKFAELLGIECRTHDNNLEWIKTVHISFPFHIRRWVPLLLYRLQVGDEQVCPQCSFVGFVDDNDAIAAEQRIRHELPHNHPIGKVLDSGVHGMLLVEADCVADKVPYGCVLFACNTVCKRRGRYTARLRDGYDSFPGETAFENILGYL